MSSIKFGSSAADTAAGSAGRQPANGDAKKKAKRAEAAQARPQSGESSFLKYRSARLGLVALVTVSLAFTAFNRMFGPGASADPWGLASMNEDYAEYFDAAPACPGLSAAAAIPIAQAAPPSAAKTTRCLPSGLTLLPPKRMAHEVAQLRYLIASNERVRAREHALALLMSLPNDADHPVVKALTNWLASVR